MLQTHRKRLLVNGRMTTVRQSTTKYALPPPPPQQIIFLNAPLSETYDLGGPLKDLEQVMGVPTWSQQRRGVWFVTAVLSVFFTFVCPLLSRF